MEDMYSDFLYARPSFLEGMARVMDIGGTLNEYNSSGDPDTIALLMDWLVVGQAMRQAIDEHETAEVDELELAG